MRCRNPAGSQNARAAIRCRARTSCPSGARYNWASIFSVLMSRRAASPFAASAERLAIPPARREGGGLTVRHARYGHARQGGPLLAECGALQVNRARQGYTVAVIFRDGDGADRKGVGTGKWGAVS